MPKLQCQTCGGMAEVGKNLRGECPYCGGLVKPVRVSSFSSIPSAGMSQIRQSAEAGGDSMALALCFLKAGNFSLAKKKLEKVIDETPECCEAYYYYALALLHGRNFASVTLRDARKITEYLQTAEELDPDFVYAKLMFGLLCIGYYKANGLTPPADGYEILNGVGGMDVDAVELDFLCRAIDPDQSVEMLSVMAQLGLLHDDGCDDPED